MRAKKLAIIQARMTSSRLPGKVMLDVAGQPMLQRMLERVQQAKSLDALVVATTTDPTDDVLAQFCRQQDILCYRGSLQDVLDRCYQAAVRFHADAVIRLTADCPLIDPEILDRTVAILAGSTTFQESQSGSITPETNPGTLLSNPASPAPIDFAADRLPPPWKRSLPIGLDVEVCRFEALQRAWQEAHEPYQREHVLPYLYEGVTFEQSTVPHGIGWYVQHGTTPRGFKVALLNHTPNYGSLRWTVDTPADLEFVRQVFARFEGYVHFTWQDVLSLLEQEPALAAINADVKHKSAFDIDHRLGN